MGSIMLSRARDFLGPHLERQIDQYETEMNIPKYIRLGGIAAGTGVGGAIVWGGLASNPFTWGIAAACFLGALAAQFKISPISGKNAAIKACGSLGQLYRSTVCSNIGKSSYPRFR